ncbi:MAG TPA: hypothetical protein VMU75_16015 [Acidimicrobiales bacterium]|nr:hypothetical protein [Acidimicrobiales bacterium]
MGHLRSRELANRLRSAGVSRLQRLSGSRDDAGAALIIVTLLIAVLASVAPLMVSQISGNTGLLLAATDQHAALEAADAGVQWYKNQLNTNPSYYESPGSDPAMATNPPDNGWCTSGTAGCGLPSSTPEEAFHYTPDLSPLYSTTGASAGELLLTVTGRAGVPGNYAYASVQASFRRASILDNTYFSNYELLDPSVIQSYVDDAGISGIDQNIVYTAAGYMVTVNGSSKSVLAATVTDAGAPSVSLWTAMCGYYTYQPNTFIDSLGQVPTNNAANPYYSSSYPYYGPFFGLYGWASNSQNAPGSFQFTQGSQTVTVPNSQSVCGGEFHFINGDTFNGPVYTEDQLHICGSPAFEGQPVSLTSGASSNEVYAYDLPGSVAVNGNNSGTGKTYPASSNGYYAPGGVIGDSSCTNNPTYASGGAGGPALNGNQAMPQTNAQLATSVGCVYSGPTMIELVTPSSGTTTMNVWSPLSTVAGGTVSSCGGGSFSATTPWVTGIALPSNGIVYVTGATSSTGVSVPDCVDANAVSTNSPSTGNPGNSTCTAGTAFVEGELSGQLTIAAAGNIVITRDITYHCVDGSGSASSANPASVSACTSTNTPDVLGLDAGNDVIVSRPSVGSSPTYCSNDGTGTISTSSSALTAAVAPTCEIQNPIVDAAVIATQGSFGDQSFSLGQSDGNLNLNGADVSDYRGPFGTFGNCSGPNGVCTGYNKVFSFDSRLAYLTPPGLLNISGAVWQEVNSTSCGDVNTATENPVTCPTLP